MEAFSVLPDPQTNGGLMIAVDPNAINDVKIILEKYNCYSGDPIGRFIGAAEKVLEII